MLSNYVATDRSTTDDCCFLQQSTTELTSNPPLEDIKTDYREIAKNPKQAMLYWLAIAMGLRSNTISIKKYIKIEHCKEQLSPDDLPCRQSWWRIYPKATEYKKPSINSIISISVTPEGYEPLMNLCTNIMHPSHKLHEYIIHNKIHNAKFADSSVDTAILYLNNDELDEEMLQKFKDAIAPLDEFALNIPFGMQPITRCSAYGEHKRPVKTKSFGNSRAMVIYDAVKACRSNKTNGIAFSLEQELEKACIQHGLNPENPAFLINDTHRFINAIPHYIHVAVENACFQQVIVSF